MRRYIAVYLLALLAISVHAQSTGSCNTSSNKFLNWLSTQDSSLVFSTPQTGSSFAICNEIWSSTGTCCNIDKMKTIFKNKMATVKEGWDKFIKGLVKVKDILEKIKTMMANSGDAMTKFQQAKNSDSSQMENLLPEQALKIMQDGATNFKADLDDFKNNGKACFEHLMKVRGIVFCLGCSASSTNTENFSSTDGKLTITQNSCSNILGKCFKTWRFFHRVGGMMHMAAVLNKQRKPDAPAPQKPDGGAAFGSVTPMDLADAFKNCTSASTTSTCTQTMLNNICIANLNMIKPEKRASDQNMDSGAVSSARLLQSTTTYSGDTTVSSSSGSDLTQSVTVADSGQNIDTSTAGNSNHSSLLNIMIAAFAVMFALLN